MPVSPPMPEPIRTPVRQRSSSVLGSQPESRHRLLGGRQSVDDEIIHAPLFLGIDPLVGIEAAVAAIAARHLTGDAVGRSSVLNLRDQAGAGLAGEQARPGLLDATSQRRDKTQARNDDPAHEADHSPDQALGFVDIFDGVTDGDDGFGGVIGNFDAEFFLERHHQLDCVEAVGPQIFNERRGVRDLVGINIQMLDDDLLHALGSIAHGLVSLS